jgi:hypothetical protein
VEQFVGASGDGNVWHFGQYRSLDARIGRKCWNAKQRNDQSPSSHAFSYSVALYVNDTTEGHGGAVMGQAIQFSHEGRELEVSTNVVGEMIEVWIREDNRVLQLYTAIPAESASDAGATGQDVVAQAMNAARSDVETGILKLPVR